MTSTMADGSTRLLTQLLPANYTVICILVSSGQLRPLDAPLEPTHTHINTAPTNQLHIALLAAD